MSVVWKGSNTMCACGVYMYTHMLTLKTKINSNIGEEGSETAQQLRVLVTNPDNTGLIP